MNSDTPSKPSSIKPMKLSGIKQNPTNPRIIKDDKFQKLVTSIKEFPEMLEARPIVVNPDMIVLGGNMRLKAAKAAGLTEAPVYVATWEESKAKEFIVKDNVGFGEWDWDILANEWDASELDEWGLDVWVPDNQSLADAAGEDRGSPLVDTFLVPPFSVLDTRQGYWMQQKQKWKALIQDNGESREGTLSTGIVGNYNNGASILDPVLAEIANRWFGLKNCKTFDCFAGDSVFGYVSNYCGNTFTGIEIRQEQVDLNNKRIGAGESRYVCDDGQNVGKHIEPNSQDLLFSCPPYFDLEVYSDLENDASNQSDYPAFLKILDTAFSASIKCLKNNRFAVIVVGDVRAKDGGYYNFPNDVKQIFLRNKLCLYNELVLVEPLGTVPQRARRYMEHRKVAKCHQNILVFYKGDTSLIKTTFPEVQISYDESENAQFLGLD